MQSCRNDGSIFAELEKELELELQKNQVELKEELDNGEVGEARCDLKTLVPEITHDARVAPWTANGPKNVDPPEIDAGTVDVPCLGHPLHIPDDNGHPVVPPIQHNINIIIIIYVSS